MLDFSETTEKISVAGEGRTFNCYFLPYSENPPEGVGKLIDFFNIWKNAFNGDNLPAWNDFSFEDFIGWHSNMRVMKRGKSKEDIHTCVIVGEIFAKFWGKKSLSEKIHDGDVTSKNFITQFQQYLDAIDNGKYGISEGKLPVSGISSQSVLFMDLPLSENGVDVSHYIAALIPLDAEE